MIRRFFYVKAPRGRTLHIQFGRSHSEGPVVACGRQAQPGWKWWRCRCDGDLPVCKRCEEAV